MEKIQARIISDEGLRDVLTICDDQERVMVLLSHRCGLRSHEIAGADWGMVTTENGADIGDVFTLPAMNSKGRCGAGSIAFADDLRSALRVQWTCGKPVRGPIIVGIDGKRLSAHAVQQRLVRLYARVFGANRGFTSHSGRRTFANKLVQKISIVDLQKCMRHARISTTLEYLDAANDDVIARATRGLG